MEEISCITNTFQKKSYIFDHRSQCGKVQESPFTRSARLPIYIIRARAVLGTIISWQPVQLLCTDKDLGLDIGTDIDDPMEFEKKGYDLE